MKMIVGLGNPGQKYVGTRHNIGFEVLGRFARKHFASTPRSKFEAEYSEIQVEDTKVILLCPLTYMNLSGQSVGPAASFFRIKPNDILVVCDDFNLEIDRLRFRPSGTSGGQNGLDDIINKLGTKDFPRLRVGIGPVPEKWNPADFVLGKFTEDENQQVDKVVDRCLLALEDWVKQDIGLCMNRYNGVSEASKKNDGNVQGSKPGRKKISRNSKNETLKGGSDLDSSGKPES
ncbi:MAG: aminoacyl-tRNA hydrolase [Planctomycetota bacterium]|nr:aminoacyl-tRNA hydrolase [Planctomycetota bacterium]